MLKLDRPRLRVDFNETIEKDLVLISRDDEKMDSSGGLVHLADGLRVYIYMEDTDDSGSPRYLLATGTVEKNTFGSWSAGVRWCCRIDHWES